MRTGIDMKFWINNKHGTIHTSECKFRQPGSYEVSDNWQGEYPTRGAAIDAVLSMDMNPREGQCCIFDRINSGGEA